MTEEDDTLTSTELADLKESLEDLRCGRVNFAPKGLSDEEFLAWLKSEWDENAEEFPCGMSVIGLRTDGLAMVCECDGIIYYYGKVEGNLSESKQEVSNDE